MEEEATRNKLAASLKVKNVASSNSITVNDGQQKLKKIQQHLYHQQRPLAATVQPFF